MKTRSTEKEWMDDAELNTGQLVKTLHEIAWLNRFFGGHKNIRSGIRKILNRLKNENQPSFSIIDLGSGLGDGLVILRDPELFPEDLQLTGIDYNERTLEEARKFCQGKNITFRKLDLNETSIRELKADVIMCNLFLHHFSDEEIRKMIANLDKKNVRSLLINDLRRSAISLILYKLVCTIIDLNPMARNDGAISIRKGFSDTDWSHYFQELACKELIIRRTWAFRYQVIVLF